MHSQSELNNSIRSGQPSIRSSQRDSHSLNSADVDADVSIHSFIDKEQTNKWNSVYRQNRLSNKEEDVTLVFKYFFPKFIMNSTTQWTSGKSKYFFFSFSLYNFVFCYFGQNDETYRNELSSYTLRHNCQFFHWIKMKIIDHRSPFFG